MSEQISAAAQGQADAVAQAAAIATAGATLKEAKFAPEMPKLDAASQAKAEEIAKVIDATDPATVMQIGSSVQDDVRKCSDQWLENVRRQDAGEAGVLLGELTDVMGDLDASTLRQVNGFLREIFSKVPVVGPWFDKTGKSVAEFLSRFDQMDPSVKGLENKLGQEKFKALTGIETLKKLRTSMNEYLAKLGILRGAIAIRIVADTKAYEEKRQALVASNSTDARAMTELEDMYAALERLERRLFSLQTAEQLTLQFIQQARGAQTQLSFTAETLGEAMTLGITAWKQGLAIAVQLLRAKNQAEAMVKFRELTGKMVVNNATMLAETERTIGSLKAKAFIAAEAVAQANNILAKSITDAKKADVDARQKRAEALRLMEESQKKVVEALKGNQAEILNTSRSTASEAAAPEAQPQVKDVAADLL